MNIMYNKLCDGKILASVIKPDIASFKSKDEKNSLEKQIFCLRIHKLLEISDHCFIKNMAKKLLKMGEAFYEHFVVSFSMFQLSKFVLPFYGET